MKNSLDCFTSVLLPIKCFDHLSKNKKKKTKTSDLMIYSSAFETHGEENWNTINRSTAISYLSFS